MSDFAIENGLRLLVDAEYTYMNDGISLMALGMMCHYNKSKAYVGNTYQCYLKVSSIKTAIETFKTDPLIDLHLNFEKSSLKYQVG